MKTAQAETIHTRVIKPDATVALVELLTYMTLKQPLTHQSAQDASKRRPRKSRRNTMQAVQ